MRFELQNPAVTAPSPTPNLGHITEEDEKSYRGSDAEVRQKARQALESLLEGNARFTKVLYSFICSPRHSSSLQLSV